MKNIAISIIAYLFSLITLFAAVPVPWTVDMRSAQPATFEAYQGETLDFKASLTLDGKPFEAPSNYSFFWQTNGMGRYYWEKKVEVGSRSRTEEFDNSIVGLRASTSTNVLFATWTPEMDVGAKVYNCFIGSPSNNYHTAFQLRLRPSPGATPNALPLPVPVIDFAKVRVLNPPWEGGGGGGVNTNAVRDIVRPMIADATNGIRSVDGAARPLPKYLHERSFDDSYPADAEWYYAQPQDYGQCSAMRDGGFIYRNYDWKFDDAAEFVVKVSPGIGRFASVGVANCGTNLTESFVTSGKPSRYYKCLPGRVVDGINENGVCIEVNVVDGEVDPDEWTGAGDLHPLGAVRWVLDHATNAIHAAKYLKDNIKFPPGWTQNFHWMICDESSTYIVENGDYHSVTGRAVMTNFPLYPSAVFGSGWERYQLLTTNLTSNITNVWYTRAYSDDTEWLSEFHDRFEMNAAKIAWDNGKGKESHRGQHDGNKWWWQSVHTSVYDLTNRILRIAVQEVDDWYVFTVPAASSPRGVDEEKAREIAAAAVAPVAAEVRQKIGGDEVSEHETDPTVPDWAKSDSPPEETDPTVPDWAKSEYPSHIYSGGGAEVLTDGNNVYIYGGNVFHGDIPMIDNAILMEVLRDYIRKDSQHQAGNIPVFSEDGGLRDGGIKPNNLAPKTMISSTDPTFTNAVIQTMKGVTPQPSPELRLWDPVLNRWVILKSVNMNITLEVE